MSHTCGKAVSQMDLYISPITSSSGSSSSVTLSDMLSANMRVSFILGTDGLALYQVELCQRQMVMKSFRHLKVRKPLQGWHRSVRISFRFVSIRFRCGRGGGTSLRALQRTGPPCSCFARIEGDS